MASTDPRQSAAEVVIDGIGSIDFTSEGEGILEGEDGNVDAIWPIGGEDDDVCETFNNENYCQNGGECIDDNGIPTCNCTTGRTGEQCKEIITENIDDIIDNAISDSAIRTDSSGGFLDIFQVTLSSLALFFSLMAIAGLVACYKVRSRPNISETQDKYIDDINEDYVETIEVEPVYDLEGTYRAPSNVLNGRRVDESRFYQAADRMFFP